jgi:hypothetical protein
VRSAVQLLFPASTFVMPGLVPGIHALAIDSAL